MRNKDSAVAVSGSPSLFPKENPYPAYKKLRDREPVHRSSPMQWIVTGYDDCVFLLEHPGISHWGQGSELHSKLFAEGALSKTLYSFSIESGMPYRKSVMHALAGKQLKFDEENMALHAEKLLSRLYEKDEIEFMADFAHPFTFGSIARIIGVPEADIASLSDTVKTLLAEGGYLRYVINPGESKAGNLFIGYLEKLIREKRQRPENDLCSELIDLCIKEQENETFILHMILILFYAGHDNMMNFLGNALYALDRFPQQQATLRENPAMMNGAVQELLRYDSPLQFLLLFAREAIPLRKKVIPAGSQILISIGGANHDPAVFPDPDSLDWGRKNRGHLSFGIGAFRCIGARLALLQASVALGQFLGNTRSYSLAEKGVDWYKNSFVQRGPASLRLEVDWKKKGD